MTCVNWSLTILSILIFASVVWPGFGGEMVSQWIVGSSAVLILIVTWTGVICKPCAVKNDTLKPKKK